MKIRWTTYKKDAAAYHPINSTEMCMDTDTLHQFTKVLGFAVTNPYRPDCYWKITSYNSAEMIQIIEE